MSISSTLKAAESPHLSTALAGPSAQKKDVLDPRDREMLENFDDLFVGNPIQIEKILGIYFLKH